MRQETARRERAKCELEAERLRLYSELQRTVDYIGIHAFEGLLRRIHMIEVKIRSFKGGIYDKE